MFRIKLLITCGFLLFTFAACIDKKPAGFVVSDSRSYESSLFRQNCAACHGAEGHGRTLDDGKVVPSLREGEFKAKTEAEIHHQISDGGNGMPPFRSTLTERELNLMTKFVYRDLRGH